MANILIVDDHATNREFLVNLLGYRGHQLFEASDGLEALDSVRKNRPDLVIADILMPTMDGYQFVNELRKEPDVGNTRVIFYSATYHEQEAFKLAARCGVSHVLTKPCEPELVLETIERILEESGTTPNYEKVEEFNRQHLRLLTDKLASVADDLGEASARYSELIRVNLQLASERDPRKLLDNVCHSARKLVGASHAILAVGRKDGDQTVYFTTSGISAAKIETLKMPALRAGAMGIVFTERRTWRANEDTLFQQSLGLPSGYPVISSCLAAPIISISHTYGWICLSNRIGGGEFSEEDERLLSILGAQVGRIYENGSLYAELQDSELKFRQLAENINEVFFLINPDDGQMLYVSPAYETIWGRTRESLYAEPGSWLDAVHPEDRPHSINIFNRTLGNGGKFDLSYRINRPDGQQRWIRARGFPILNSAGEFYRIAGIADDITEGKLAEQKIQRLNRVHAVLSGINTAIVRIRDRQELFNEACRIAVDEGRFRMAWLGMLTQDRKDIIPQAKAGYVAGYLRQPGLTFMDRNPDRMSASGTAIRTRLPCIRNNIASDRDSVPWKKEALERGYQAVAAFPLLKAGEPFGVISLYAAEPDFFDEDEIRLLIELASDISYAVEFIENENRLNYLAFHDPLTGLANRASLHAELSRTCTRNGSGKPCALLLLNMNDFRNINDTLGHHNGDDLIRQVGRRLKSTVWASDIVACLGGDDFAVLLPQLASKEHIGLVIKKIQQALQHTFIVSDIPLSVEVTLGIALFPDHGDTAELLWQHADIALRTAKQLYKNHLFYDPALNHYDPAQLVLIGELREAIDRNHLVLHYQPKISLPRGRTTGVEALVRWQHPERGLIYPDKFIPLVENTELIDPLTVWVIANACRQTRCWRRNGFPLDLSVNLSVRNLQNPNLLTEIIDLARSSRFPLKHLILELTESAIMVDPVHAKEVLTELHGAGIVFSMDDFGIGQTSLSYLKELPISKMKIDKSFIIDFNNPSNRAIVRSAIDLARNLGLTVTAEGVEDRATFITLKKLGCDQGQGYYFSKPLPANELASWLKLSDWPVESRTS